MTNSQPLVVPPGRLLSIAYHVVGVQTEAGQNPYTKVVNAGGASGPSLGMAQNDFLQHPEKASPYATALAAWSSAEGTALSFNVSQMTAALKSGALSADMRDAVKAFGSSEVGAQWINKNFDMPHFEAAVQAAERAFATPYGQAVLAEDVHVEEFAGFAMKVFNQYGGGNAQKVDGKTGALVRATGFQALMDYLDDGVVELKDNQHLGQVRLVSAGNPNEFNRQDLLDFARAYTDTRKTLNEAVYNGPLSALNSGSLYNAILDSDSPLSDVLKRVETKGDFSPTLVNTDPDVALARAMFGADTGRMKSAVAAINDATTLDPINVSATLGQYPGSLWIDPLSGRIALSYKDSNSGFVVDANGYVKFASSTVVKDDGVRTLQIGEGDAAVGFDQIATPLVNSPLPHEAAAILPIGHWEEQTIYTDLGLPLTTQAVWVPGPTVTNAAPPVLPSAGTAPPTNHTTTGTIYLSRDSSSATLPDGQVINAGPGGRLELGADGNLSATRPVTGYSPEEAVYSVTLYNKIGQAVASTQIQVVADPAHPNDPAYNTTVVQGQVRDITQIQPDGSSTIIRTVFQTGTGWVEQGTGEIVQSMAQGTQERLAQTPVPPSESSGAGDGGGGDGDTDPPLNVIDIPVLDLVSHFTGDQTSGAYGAGQLGGYDVLPFNENSSFLVNADGDMVGEVNRLPNGYTQVKELGGNTFYFNEKDASVLTQDQYQQTQTQTLTLDLGEIQRTASAIGLMNTIIGLQHWDNMSDLQRTAALASIYNVADQLTGGNALPGDLGTAASALGLLNALDRGDLGSIAYSGLSLVEHLTSTAGVANSGWVSANMPGGGSFLPGLGFVLALDSGDPVSIASSGMALMSSLGWIGPWGMVAGAVIGVFGGLFGDDDSPDIPMREGLAHAQWDAAGMTVVITDQDVEGGGASATSWMSGMIDGLQARLANTRDEAGNTYALVPNLLPTIGFKYDPDGFNLANGARGFVYLKWTDDNGQSQTRYYDGAGSRGDGTGETLAGDFMQHAAGAIAPAWAVATILAHYQFSECANDSDWRKAA